jgi:hypothetical protein
LKAALHDIAHAQQTELPALLFPHEALNADGTFLARAH